MARIPVTRNIVLALLASSALLIAAGAVLVRAQSGGGGPAGQTAAQAPLAAAPAPAVPALHWPADGLRQLLAAVEASRDEGLHPADYRRDALAEAVESGRSDAATDTLATDSARLLARDYADGHVHNRARFDWHIDHSPAALASLDADLRKAVEGGTLDTYLRGLLPQDARYVALRDALRDTPPDETARITHIRASMERWRWMPRVLGDDYIWVNVPTYKLALMHGDSVAATHVVVVGAPKTPTPMLSATIGSVIVNPWWTLPPKVLAEGHGKRYAAARGYVYVTIHGKPYVRQKPGPDNALGRMKIDMPNAYAIYLHDTPAKWAFGKTERALSHGCIRVQGIATLAGDLTAPDTVADALTDFTTHTLPIAKTVPVYIVYFTAAPDADGKVVTYGDPYDRDDELVAALDHRRFKRATPVAAPKRSALTPKRDSTTNGVPDEPERAENPGTNATY
jgi:murein L,D-transpeptidase YcbB/YkuD